MALSRGQAGTIEVILSTIILAFLVFGLVTFLEAETRNAQSGLLEQKRDRLALSAVSQLVQTPGQPENWGSLTCTRLGLSCGEGTLCPEKLSRLSMLYSSDYNKTRGLLNLQAYQISIQVCNPSDYGNCSYNFTAPAREALRLASSHVSRAEMLSTLGGETVSVIVFAWE